MVFRHLRHAEGPAPAGRRRWRRACSRPACDLTNGGDLEKAQQMAAHEIPRTTKLYDRRSDVVSLDEVEKVVF